MQVCKWMVLHTQAISPGHVSQRSVHMEQTTTPRRRLEPVVATAAAAAGCAAVLAGAGYGLTATVGVGAGLVPAVAGGLLLLGALAWGVELWLARRRSSSAATTSSSAPPVLERLDAVPDADDDDVQESLDRQGVLRVAAVLVTLVATAALFEVLGFALATFLMLLVLLRGVSRRSWKASLLTAVVASLLARQVFEGWLGTALPHSTLPLLSGWGL